MSYYDILPEDLKDMVKNYRGPYKLFNSIMIVIMPYLIEKLKDIDKFLSQLKLQSHYEYSDNEVTWVISKSDMITDLHNLKVNIIFYKLYF